MSFRSIPLLQTLCTLTLALPFLASATRAAAAPAAPPEILSVNVKIDESRVLNQTDDLYHGTNFVGYWNNVGDSPETRQAFSQSGMKLLRFPGGVPAQWYDWQTFKSSDPSCWTHQQAWNVAKAAGAQMVYQTNIANDKLQTDKKTNEQWRLDSSGEHQAGWLKAAADANIKVAFWEIGNEPEMDAPAAFKKGSDTIMRWYDTKFEEQVRAIRQVDPKARIMGGALTNMYQWWAERNLEKFLVAHGNKQGTGLVDAISLHWYVGGEKGDWTKSRSLPQKWTAGMEYIHAAIQAYDSRDLPVYITEWNFGGGMNNLSATQYFCALGNADVVGMFLKTGIKGHNHFCLHGASKNWGMLYMKGGDKKGSEPAPSYFSLALAAKLWGHVVEADADVDQANVLSTYAAQDSNNTMNVMLINKGDKTATVNVSFSNLKFTGQPALLYRLEPAAGDIKATTVIYNGLANPQPQTDNLPAPAKLKLTGPLTVKLNPYAMAVIAIPNSPPITAQYVRPVISDAVIKRLKVGQVKLPPLPASAPATAP